MATKRMTGKNYKKELSDLDTKTRSLEGKVNVRLLELTTAYPDVDLPCSRAGGLKCKEIAHKWIIEETTLSAKIEYIEAIEKYIADKHPHKQTNIEFDNSKA